MMFYIIYFFVKFIIIKPGDLQYILKIVLLQPEIAF
jgi:hypothetical protein